VYVTKGRLRFFLERSYGAISKNLNLFEGIIDVRMYVSFMSSCVKNCARLSIHDKRNVITRWSMDGSGRMLRSIPLLRAAGLRPGKIRFFDSEEGKAPARALFDLLLKVKSRHMAQR